MSGKAPQGDADENDDVYTVDSNDEQERAPQRQPKAAKPAKPTKVRQRPRRQKQKRDMISEDDDVQDEAKAMQPYEGRRSQQLEASPAQAGGRIQKQGQQQGEQVQGKGKDEDTGLKLRLDLNLDIEVDLKASIRGDLTLALL